MSAIGSITGLQSGLLGRLQSVAQPEKLSPSELGSALKSPLSGESSKSEQVGFGKLFEGMISAVDSQQQLAGEATKKVLLGQTDQLHQSVIAMQEASVSFSLMLEVRNKLVDSYQELMRMPV